ncbi:hypothetical protein AJ80_05957 [Polytolypa hystricis UAMH7299]|uniref:Uncharacterized protein n=1 Tax=Polytolypa hystricis (strain UAMH7299) TaxID=1447883 RepID=A0A2B7Y0Y4_POLH7|nr:hypothetical protein AJ80_05957 [Polytolypa hystricis UAMH7299]
MFFRGPRAALCSQETIEGGLCNVSITELDATQPAPKQSRQNLLNSEEWKSFLEEYFKPLDFLTSTVALLVEGGEMTDAKGRKVTKGSDYGLTVEVNGRNFYFRDQVDYCDETAAFVMKATSVENQSARLDSY